MPIGKSRGKSEQALGEHIKKALSTVETAPKQKHVRACIVNTWDFQGSQSFWAHIRMQPVLTDQVVCYKALITIHKVLVGGPHVVLSEALIQKPFFESCMRQHGSITLGFGYGPLIQAYCEFLLAKLEFHRQHPEFTGNFNYEEYLSLKGVSNLDEGYQRIEKLMDLQERVDRFQKTVFINVRPMAQNECRIASLVPLIEESYGIYKFITSMLSAMHLCVESADPLLPLVEKYNEQFYALKKFYGECQTLRYLTSLVEIPKLPEKPPSFDQESSRERTNKSRPKSPEVIIERNSTPEKIIHDSSPVMEDLLGDFDETDDDNSVVTSDFRSRSGSTHLSQLIHTTTHVPVVDERALEALKQAQLQIISLNQQLEEALQRYNYDQNLLQQYDSQLRNARQQIAEHLRIQESSTNNNEWAQHVQFFEQKAHKLEAENEDWKQKYYSMSNEAAKWKAKFEGMSALYNQLRTEHLDALSKLKELQIEKEMQSEKDKDISAQIDEKQNDMADALGSHLASELLRVTQAIEAAAKRLEDLRTDPSLEKLSNSTVHAAIVDGAATITTAIGNLIRYAIKTQEEIVLMGKGSGTPDAFYKKHSQWTNGLISAAQTVAAATMTLVEVADGVIKGTHKLQHLIAASNSVAAATMQLVTASRVKASANSKVQPLLENAAKAVSDANRRLVDSAASAGPSEGTQLKALPEDSFALKVEELERQAKVLALEKELSMARNDLASVRKAAYTNISGDTDTSICSSHDGSTISNDKVDKKSNLLVDDDLLLN